MFCSKTTADCPTDVEVGNEGGGLTVLAHRVNKNEGCKMSVWDPVALEPDCHHIAITGLETEWPGHLDVSGKTQDIEKH